MQRKTILITGVTGGVGRALLPLVQAAGWDAVGVYRQDRAGADALAAAWQERPDGLRLFACDATDAEQVERLFADLTENYCPDVLVHVAGQPFEVKPVQRATWSEFQTQIDGVLKSVVMVTQPLLRRMVRRGNGRIVAALSAVVLGEPPRGFASYTTAKYALSGYLKSVATECIGRGVTVNTVSPGPMKTAMLSHLPDLLTEQMRQSVPGGNWIAPDAVARAIFWLAAEAGPEVTGCNIPVTSSVGV